MLRLRCSNRKVSKTEQLKHSHTLQVTASSSPPALHEEVQFKVASLAGRLVCGDCFRGPPGTLVMSHSHSLFLSPGLWCRGFTPYAALSLLPSFLLLGKSLRANSGLGPPLPTLLVEGGLGVCVRGCSPRTFQLVVCSRRCTPQP